MQKTGSGFGTSRRLPEGALADLEPSPLAFIETPAARLSKLRLTASVTLETCRGGFYQRHKSPDSANRKSEFASSGCLGCSPAVNPRNLRKACGFPSAFSDSPPARRALSSNISDTHLYHIPNTKYHPRHVSLIQNDTCLSRYIYIFILPIYLSSFVKETLSGH